MIEFHNVSLDYSSHFHTLYNCNLKINCNSLLLENETFSHLAIMRIISKIDKNYLGEILIDDKNLKQIKDKDLPIAYLPENPVLFENKTIKNNLEYVLKIRKINKNEYKNIINSIINKYNFNKNKKIKKLTLSEKKLICLMRVIIRKPKYLLLENFFNNFDETYYNIAYELIKNIQEFSIIIACENKNLNIYNNFKKIKI